jgi:hypothetical protein
VTVELDADAIRLLGGLVLGVAFGALVQARHFCIMGAVADLVLFGSARRLRVWLLAIATAVLGTQLLAAVELVPLGESGHLGARLGLGPALLGGLLFGFGMVLTGGCASRALVRAAAGSLKSFVVLLVMGLAALTAQLGLLAPAHGALRELTTVSLGSGAEAQALWRPLTALGLDAEPARLLATLALAGGLSAFVFADRRLRASRADLATGAALGLLIVLGWLTTGWLAADPFEPRAPSSLSYVGSVAQSLALVATGSTSASFGPALVLGTLLGAAALAPSACGFRLDGFVSGADLARHLVGAVLMGVGGTVAMGCTIGQGLSGISTLSVTSLVATLAIVAGAAWALRYLESGRLLPKLTPSALLRAGVAGRRGGPPWRTASGGDM